MEVFLQEVILGGGGGRGGGGGEDIHPHRYGSKGV